MTFSVEKTSDYVCQSLTAQSGFTAEGGWVVLSHIEASIKRKIEAVGTPLKEWDVNIYRGILTGYNDAFIIDKKTREELIVASPKNEEIIRPILRGRDIKKYKVKFADQWIINAHNGVKDKNIARVDVEAEYPAVLDYLNIYKAQLEMRLDKGFNWYNLRNCAYLEDFKKEKIIWLELTDHPNFALDTNGYLLNNTIFFMTGQHLKYLLAFLNSRLCEWYFDKIASTSGVGTRRWIKIYIDQIRIPVIDSRTEIEFNKVVNEINESKISHDKLKEIDFNIYKLFSFDEDEIAVLESAIL